MNTRRYDARHAGAKFTQESVERALTNHLGQGGPRGWTLDPEKGHYLVPTALGILRLATVREAYIFAVGMAEKNHRIEHLLVDDEPEGEPL